MMPRTHLPVAQSPSSLGTTPSSTPPSSPAKNRLASRVPEAARRARARRDWAPPDWRAPLSRRDTVLLALFFAVYTLSWLFLFGAELVGRGAASGDGGAGKAVGVRNATQMNLEALISSEGVDGVRGGGKVEMVGEMVSAAAAGSAVGSFCDAASEGIADGELAAKCSGDVVVAGDEESSILAEAGAAAAGGIAVGRYGRGEVHVSTGGSAAGETAPSCGCGGKNKLFGAPAPEKKCGCGCAETGVCNCKSRGMAREAAEADVSADSGNSGDSVSKVAGQAVPLASSGARSEKDLNKNVVSASCGENCSCGCAETGVCTCNRGGEESSDVSSVSGEKSAAVVADASGKDAVEETAPTAIGGSGHDDMLTENGGPACGVNCGCGCAETGVCTCNRGEEGGPIVSGEGGQAVVVDSSVKEVVDETAPTDITGFGPDDKLTRNDGPACGENCGCGCAETGVCTCHRGEDGNAKTVPRENGADAIEDEATVDEAVDAEGVSEGEVSVEETRCTCEQPDAASGGEEAVVCKKCGGVVASVESAACQSQQPDVLGESAGQGACKRCVGVVTLGSSTATESSVSSAYGGASAKLMALAMQLMSVKGRFRGSGKSESSEVTDGAESESSGNSVVMADDDAGVAGNVEAESAVSETGYSFGFGSMAELINNAKCRLLSVEGSTEGEGCGRD